MTWYQLIPFKDISVNVIVICVGYLVITRRLIWHKDYERKCQELDEWKRLALRLLSTTEKVTSQQEVITKVVVDEGDGHELAP